MAHTWLDAQSPAHVALFSPNALSHTPLPHFALSLDGPHLASKLLQQVPAATHVGSHEQLLVLATQAAGSVLFLGRTALQLVRSHTQANAGVR